IRRDTDAAAGTYQVDDHPACCVGLARTRRSLDRQDTSQRHAKAACGVSDTLSLLKKKCPVDIWRQAQQQVASGLELPVAVQTMVCHILSDREQRLCEDVGFYITVLEDRHWMECRRVAALFDVDEAMLQVDRFDLSK